MRVLILGVSGFLGNALWRYIHNTCPEAAIKGVSRHKIKGCPGVEPCDLNQTAKLQRIIRAARPDCIFHLVGGRESTQELLLESNILSTFSLYQALSGIKNFRPRIIIPGSAAEYGAPKTRRYLFKESDQAKPQSDYGIYKNIQVSMSLMMSRCGFDVVVGRIFNISGNGVPGRLAIGRFCELIVKSEKKGSKVIPTGDLGGRRDFLDVEDICSALWAIAKRGQRGEIYNVSSGRAYQMRDVLKQLIRLSHVPGLKIQEAKEAYSHSFDVIGSNRKIRQLGWRPKVSLRQSLWKALEYYRNLAT